MKGDKEELLALLRMSIPKYFHPSEEQDFVVYLDEKREDYFIVENVGKIIGCGGVNYLNENKEGRISWDVIHPDFQGKGIGRLLTQHRIDHIKEKPSIELIKVRTSQLAFRFYEKMGFVLQRVEKDFWAEGFDLMR